MTIAGGTWDELEDSLTWPRIEALYDYWRDYPPIHEILRAVYQIKSPKRDLTVEEVKRLAPPPGNLSIDQLRDQFNKSGGLKMVVNNG